MCLFLFPLGSEAENNPEASRQLYRGIFRVNTNISSGEKSISKITRKAKEAGIDFIVFSDQFLVKCQYGIPPFRNVFSISKERQSVSTFGIENYLNILRDESLKNDGPVIIAGVDIAPHYYWDWDQKGNLICRQFSQQLTIFGELDSKFLRNLPVIHNSRFSLDPLVNIVKLSPLLLLIISYLLMRRQLWYSDAQGNKYYKPKGKKRHLAAAAAIFALAIIWTLNNKPFVEDMPFDQYRDYAKKPYQEVIDYVRREGAGKAGIVWSTPEARSENEIHGVKLITERYSHVITETQRYDGFAGIYADARTAHLPGREWDKALLDYCKGDRENPPFVYGELDYRKDFEGIPFDYIKTFVFVEDAELNTRNIIDALLSGASYASMQRADAEIIIDEFSIRVNHEKIFPGETLHLKDKQFEFFLAGHIESSKTELSLYCEIILILNGKEFMRKTLNGEKFEFRQEIKAEQLPHKMNYLRFLINSPAGEIVANPLFIKIR